MENNIKYTDWLESHGFVLIKEEDIRHEVCIPNMKTLTKLTYQKATEDNSIILEVSVAVSQGVLEPYIEEDISSIIPYQYCYLHGLKSVYKEPENELVQVISNIELHCGVGNGLVDSLTLK